MRILLILLTLLALSVPAFSLACQTAPEPTHATPTPTPIPDAETLVKETADNLLALESTKFSLTHETGSIFLPPPVSTKLTGASGAWSATHGVTIAIDAYRVPNAQADPQSGIYLPLQMVITPDSYYGVDPVAGKWIKQPLEAVPIPVIRLNELVADLVSDIENPALAAGRDNIDGMTAFRITGDAPADVLDWLMLTGEPGQTVAIEFWIDTKERLLRKLRIQGPIGNFDAPDTAREILFTEINEPVAIDLPREFDDHSGG